MVNYKVRSFFEKDTGTAGADVIIYSDTGDVVDTLLITTESTYNDLVEQLEGIDEKYLDRQDVLTILQNTSQEIVEINATYLNGNSSDYYAPNNHNHDSVYAPLGHVNILSTDAAVGHAKIINNVSRESFVNGEALSAYQGKLLSDRISSHHHRAWSTLVNNTSCQIYYTAHEVLVAVSLYANSNRPRSYDLATISDTNLRPKANVAFPSSTIGSYGEPYAYIKVNTSGQVTLTLAKDTYNKNGGTTIYGSLHYPRK